MSLRSSKRFMISETVPRADLTVAVSVRPNARIQVPDGYSQSHGLERAIRTFQIGRRYERDHE
jgi:hypothetical protein